MFAVFDASVFVRALVDRETTALRWLERLIAGDTSVAVPDLVFAEIANSLLRYVRHGILLLGGADRRIEFCRALPLEVQGVGSLAGTALALAERRSLSVYDACYAVLAEARGAVLVTADKGLSEAVERAELLPERSLSDQGR